MTKPVSIVWFRRDLRCADNPALVHAAARGAVVPVFILDDTTLASFSARSGAASNWWLHHSLSSLNESLTHHLNFFRGDALEILLTLIATHSATAVFMNRCYEPWHDSNDQRITRAVRAKGIEVLITNAQLLFKPEDITKADGRPYKIFTAFYNHVVGRSDEIPLPLKAPDSLTLIKDRSISMGLDELALLPPIPWYKPFEKVWDIGEHAAENRFYDFLAEQVTHYPKKRDMPGENSISRLSPHLHFGEISPRTLWHAIAHKNDPYLREIIWREFAYYLLHYFPHLPTKNIIARFDQFPWQKNRRLLKAWHQGQTGYPLVDAGMRELWQTGFMHNRVRMVVASFLVKNLLIDWREGAAWFYDCLVDADSASNSMNWQWVAGCGVDSAPFFRIFNPTTQGEKFDADGSYTRRYVPELSALPDKYLFTPWLAPAPIRAQAGVSLGTTYPYPIVDLAFSRARALEAFRQLPK